jgi:hypothetical protein
MNTVLTLLKEKVKASDSQVEIVKLSREIRQALNTPPNAPIRDVRLFFNYTIPKSLLYLNRYCDIVLSRLITKKFLCPNYHHLYIRVANTKEDALANIVIAEEWHTYGIAVLKEETLLSADEDEKQLLVLNAIKDGLLDIAALDKLDKAKIEQAIEEAKTIGILGEVILKSKENKRIIFSISIKGTLEQFTEEIYFTIFDKERNTTAKWKFGKENIFVIRDWFGTINVTNKKITIKPRANMDLALEGKPKIIELDVEKELADLTKSEQK